MGELEQMNNSGNLARLLERYYSRRMISERRSSENTIDSYTTCFRCLIAFATARLGKSPDELNLGDLDADLISAFLDYLESERGNSVRTRNIRHAAIRSFYKFAAFEAPENLGIIQRVRAIPQKREPNRTMVDHLSMNEATAIINAFPPNSRNAARNSLILEFAFGSAFRNSEIRALTPANVTMGKLPYVTCIGKGRKERQIPLKRQLSIKLAEWISSHNIQPNQPLFSGPRGHALSADTLQAIVRTAKTNVAKDDPSFENKRVTPHVCRHTAAVSMLEAGVDYATIGSWLGHASLESTRIYAVPTMKMKRAALEKVPSLVGPIKKYLPDGELMKFLKAQQIRASRGKPSSTPD